ncbi:Di-copper centre-containing protein [Thozetella sp. PMI_491]|nr:Di-copper centre-containing protein [Thozetella sp. PMI_491]
MRLLAPTLALGAFLVAGAAGDCCTNPRVRREWRALSDAEKLEYISAVQCLQSTPGSMQHLFDGVRSRFDDFQGLHINLTDIYHFTGPFHPWHRQYVYQYESDLIDLCGYTGAQPYWDWTLDSESEEAFLASPVFDATTGFGGNGPYVDTSNFTTTNVPVKIPGKTGGGCVLDGPFVNMTVAMGPGPTTAYNPRCLARDFSPSLAISKLNSTVVDATMALDTFAVWDFHVQGTGLEVSGMGYHAGGHLGIGNMYSSPGDPLFFLHHANMDRLWNEWQRTDWTIRKTDIAGPDTMFAYPFDFQGEVAYQNITLDTELDFWELLEDVRYVKISEVMDIYSAKFCYTYE